MWSASAGWAPVSCLLVRPRSVTSRACSLGFPMPVSVAESICTVRLLCVPGTASGGPRPSMLPVFCLIPPWASNHCSQPLLDRFVQCLEPPG